LFPKIVIAPSIIYISLEKLWLEVLTGFDPYPTSAIIIRFDNSVINYDIVFDDLTGLGLSFIVFNATFDNISVILWRLVLLVEETGVPGELLANFIT